MLPILVQHLPMDRDRMGLRPVQMAGRLGLTLAEYRALEAGELDISNDLEPPLLVPRSHLAASTDNEDLGCLDRQPPPFATSSAIASAVRPSPESFTTRVEGVAAEARQTHR
jgi:hypothetical protein